MTVKSIKKELLRIMCLAALALSVTSCLKEDLTDCYDSYTLKVKAYNNEGGVLTRKDVQDVILYVFDSDYHFVERIDTRVEESVTITTKNKKGLHIVGWGNLGSNLQDYTDPEVGTHKDECQVSLLADARRANFALSPADLFRGEITVGKEERKGETILPVYRETGSMTITVRNLKPFAGFDDDNYSVVVRETASAIDFSGSHSGEMVSYAPDGLFVLNSGKEDYYVPPFNKLPSSGLYIDIYHGTRLVVSVSADNAGNAIKVEKGLLTNVLIDLKALVSVSLSLTPWGEEQFWKEF